MRILVVEDNEMNRDLLARFLRRHGHEVIIAVDGAEAIVQAGAKPDVILMDLSMPVMDGWTATTRLKGDPSTRSIPVIALTAHAMTGDRARALAVGCDDYETKPIDFKRLIGKIERYGSGTVSDQ